MAVGEADRQSSVDEAERAIATIFLAARAGQLLLSTFMVVSQRRRVKYPKLHLLLLAGAFAESGWLAHRIVKAGRYCDRTAMWSDTLATAAGLVVCESILVGDSGAPWMKNLVIGSGVGLNVAERRRERILGLAILGASELSSGLRARGQDSHVAGFPMAASDVINLVGTHLTSQIYVAMRRRFAILLDQTTTLRIEQCAAMSTEKERARQHRLLHRATVEVLNGISGCPDRESASQLAQQEASRLRHVLRTRGQVPSRLDRALYDVCEEIRARGLTVELVSAELAHEVNSETVAAAWDAIRETALAALELGRAPRAVIRATSDPKEVEITVRDHGLGFSPGNGSPYEERLNRLHEILGLTGGSADVWSAEGSGVRVTLRVPVARASDHERSANQTIEGLPDVRVGSASQRDDNGTVRNRHVYQGLDAALFRASEDQIRGKGFINDVDTGRKRPTLKASPQQRSIGHDLGGSARTHASRMAGGLRQFVGRITPFAEDGSDEDAWAEQTLHATFLVNRLSGLATGVVVLAGGWRHIRSKSASASQVGLAIAETIWLERRARGRRWLDARASIVESVVVSATQVIGRMNTHPKDRSTWVNWAPWSLATNAIAGQAMAPQESMWRKAGVTSVISISASWALSDGFAELVANGAGMAGFFVGGEVIARHTRQSLARLREANESAVREGARLAQVAERSRQLRYLHDGALQTLETVGSGRYADLESIRAFALQEASHLQKVLADDHFESLSLEESLVGVVRHHERLGLRIDLQIADIFDPTPELISAFRDATSEALTNIQKHAETERAVVRVEQRSGALYVAIQDSGCGFDSDTTSGFGTEESISRRMREAGGSSEIRSRRGIGTEVLLRGPA